MDVVLQPARRMPVAFVGHGNPLNALEENHWSRGFAELARMVPRPSAVLAVSAHWFVEGTSLTADARPRTIHDFSGFPPELYEVRYAAPGAPDIAERARAAIGAERAALSADWGLDHGTWSVLRWMYPQADVPTLQLSIDRTRDAREHLDIGRCLRALRHEGVLLLGSGNLVHNLSDAFARARAGSSLTPEWAMRFDQALADALSARDTDTLLDALLGSQDGRISHPTPEHFLPLLYVLGASDERDRVRFPMTGFDMGSISMRSVIFG